MQTFVYTIVTVAIQKNDPFRPTTLALGTYKTKVDAEREFNLYCSRMMQSVKQMVKISEYARFEDDTTVYRVHILCSELN